MENYPIQIKYTWLRSLFLALFMFLLTPFGLLMAFSATETSNQMIGFVVFIILGGFGILLLISSIKGHGKVVLSLNEEGILYCPPFQFTKRSQYTSKKILWRDIEQMGIIAVSAGRSRQYYLKINVFDADKYLDESQEKKQKKFTFLSKADGNTALMVIVGSLHIKRKKLEEVLKSELAKHEAEREKTYKELSEAKAESPAPAE